jgi:hypothetical protein
MGTVCQLQIVFLPYSGVKPIDIARNNARSFSRNLGLIQCRLMIDRLHKEGRGSHDGVNTDIWYTYKYIF